MFHLEPSSKKELKHIGLGCAACCALELLVFFILHLIGIAPFDLPVILGALIGSAVAVVNFLLLIFSVQAVAAMQDEKNARARMQVSYSRRFLFQGVWCILTLLLDCFNPVSGIFPLLFPRLIITFMQITGYYKKPASEGGEK